MSYSILVTGSGNTTRANVEALIDDYFYAYPDLNIYLAINGSASDGQVWLAQYAEEKGKPISAVITDGANMVGIPSYVERAVAEDPVTTILDFGDVQEALVLWSDEDTVCLNVLEACSKLGIAARNLTDGLLELVPADGITRVEKAEVPAMEQLPVEEVDLEEESDEELEEAEGEYEDPLYEAINVVAQIFAEAIAKELKKALKK